ncbi:metalloregulator ArsR/SmtB family transcription factor [soil metagenome]
MATYQETFEVLGDSSRRAILEALRYRPRAVGDLARQLPISRPAVSQHLKVLQQAGLVAYDKQGTRNMYHPRADGLLPLKSWIDQFWTDALTAFAEYTKESSDDDPHF